MAPRKQLQEQKVILFKEIRKHKDLLFFKPADRASQAQKNEKWMELDNFAKTLGISDPATPWTQTKKIWNNSKKHLMKKISLSGREGRMEVGLSEVDEIIMDTLNQGTPKSKHLEGNGAEAFELNDTPNPRTPKSKHLDGNGAEANKLNDTPNPGRANQQQPEPNSDFIQINEQENLFIDDYGPIYHGLGTMEEPPDLLKDLYEEKIKVETLNIILSNYKLKLEIYELEQKLNVDRSVHTMDIERTYKVEPQTQFVVLE